MLKELYTYRYAILFGSLVIIGFLAGIAIGLNSLNHL